MLKNTDTNLLVICTHFIITYSCTHGTLHTARHVIRYVCTHSAHAYDATKEEEFADSEQTRTEFKF